MRSQIASIIKARIAMISSKQEFDETLEMYKSSKSPDKVAAIEMIENAFPFYSKGTTEICAEASKQIEEAHADMDDIGA